MYSINGGVKSDHFIKVVSARSLHSKSTFFWYFSLSLVVNALPVSNLYISCSPVISFLDSLILAWFNFSIVKMGVIFFSFISWHSSVKKSFLHPSLFLNITGDSQIFNSVCQNLLPLLFFLMLKLSQV